MDTSEELNLTDSLDTTIIMHRDAHFDGNFENMLAYYERGGKGCHPDIDVERIQRLAEMEKSVEQNLATTLMTEADIEKVGHAKQAYEDLRELYDNESAFTKHPQLIADLILTESEDAPEEIAAIVKEKGSIVKALIRLIQAEEYHDPLFPGYGKAPALAIKCLGEIGDKGAIITLFESLDGSDFFDEEIALKAIKGIGAPARDFLLKVLNGKPLTADNDRAAFALIQFRDDPEVVKKAIEMLKDPEIQQSPLLSVYLVLICEEMRDAATIKGFEEILKQPALPGSLKQEMQSVLRGLK